MFFYVIVYYVFYYFFIVYCKFNSLSFYGKIWIAYTKYAYFIYFINFIVYSYFGLFCALSLSLSLSLSPTFFLGVQEEVLDRFAAWEERRLDMEDSIW